MVICVATSLTVILPASAQNSDKTDEYKTLLKKIMTLSGSSASSEAIMSQFMSSMQKGPFQQDEAYWKDFAAKWTQKIEDKVMEVYAPIYQQHMTLDELKKVVAFYESPAGKKLGETASAVANESMPMIQQLSMEMVQEIMPQIQKSMNVVENKVVDPNKERDQKLFDAAYTAPGDSIEIAPDRTYEHGMGTKPLLYSIEKRKNDTKVTFLQPIYFDWQWLYYSPGFKIVDKRTGDEYRVRGYDGGAPLDKLMIIKGCDRKYIYVSLLFPKLKKSVKEIDIIEAITEEDVLPSNDDGKAKSYFDVKVDDYLVLSKKNKKVYY